MLATDKIAEVANDFGKVNHVKAKQMISPTVNMIEQFRLTSHFMRKSQIMFTSFISKHIKKNSKFTRLGPCF